MSMDYSWKITTGILCAYGFLKEVRPSEPYQTEYLIDPRYPNITLEQVYKDVYPVWTYSYLAIMPLLFLITDFFRYRAIIIIEGFSFMLLYLLLLYTKGLVWMQVAQFVFSVATSTEVAYFTYIYAKVDSSHYQVVTSLTRVALLLGRFTSGFLGQLLMGLGVTEYRGLNYISFSTVTLSTVICFCLPKVKTSIYFHRDEVREAKATKYWRTILGFLKDDSVAAFSNIYVLKWCVWFSIAMGINFQVGNFIQPLWETIAPHESNSIYNGGTEAIATLMGAILAFIIGYVKVDWTKFGDFILFLYSLVSGGLLLLMAGTSHIWVAYPAYSSFRSISQMIITIASFEIARNIHEDSYGLVFGINAFFALLWQTILTLVFVDDIGLGLPPRVQFYIYGGFLIGCGCIFMVLTCVAKLCKRCRQ